MAKAIMIQGTTSNAGKSLLAAGLCRVFARRGLGVAPFKSQNMALNSYITADGLEMGRAQVVQAECAGVAPDVRMNPILLKPTSDSGSQVILNGEVLGNMSAREYYAYKRELIAPVRRAYESLAAEFDVVVLEGAGSPAEINLKEGDLVNMGMARMARAPVLLVGDIDRGGVFASLAGTHLLFEDWERQLLKGVVINKFRGDPSILKPGLGMLEERIGKPVLGVIPYLHVDIDDEDSLSERLEGDQRPGLIDIAVIRLPRLSNFTDFRVFSAIPGVSVRYVGAVRDLGRPDLIVLPGTKSTMDDLRWLRQCGLEAEVLKFAAGGGAVAGICGGYQMLGRGLRDPHGSEGGGELRGLGLLPQETVFAPKKTRRQVSGSFRRVKGLFSGLSGLAVRGYEIHMGETTITEAATHLTDIEDGAGNRYRDGLVEGGVFGTYVHGIFDGEQVALEMVRTLARAKGIDPDQLGAESTEAYKERQYNQLADALESSLDLVKIEEIMEAGV